MDLGLGPNKLSRSVGLWVGPKDWPIEPRSESCDLSKIVGLGFDLFWAWPNVCDIVDRGL